MTNTTETDMTDRLEQVEEELRESVNRQALIRHYMNLTYRVVCEADEHGVTVSHPELSGCYSYAPTLEEALSNLHEVKEVWIEGKLAAGLVVPEPRV